MEANGRTEGGMCKNSRERWGRWGRLNAKISQICPLPSDGDPVVYMGVYKVCTRILVSIGYGANIYCTPLHSSTVFL